MLLTLASRSPRRRELLSQLGLALEVRPADTDETPLPGETPRDYVHRVARDKARAVKGETVLGADTVVVVGGEILGKPLDPVDARRMLRALSGTEHQVITGVCARRGDIEEVLEVTTHVRFAPLTEAQLSWYLSTGEPLDKAGAYAVQGAGGMFVVSLRGSPSNVIGLPLAEVVDLLGRVGFELPWETR